MQFDLISDLHIEFWKKNIEWKGLGTSLVAVIAGDVSQDLDLAYHTVVEISKHYRHVIYVDGNHEHQKLGGINSRRDGIQEQLEKYRNITYLYRNTVVLDSTAFVGCNGWFSYDFCEPMMSKQECIYRMEQEGHDQQVLFEQWEMAMEDADHMANVISNLNADANVKDIVLVTHTVPNRLLSFYPGDDQIHKLGVQGSSFLENIPRSNTRNKIKVWAFGHVHQQVDHTIEGIRYVCNPRGIPAHGNQTVYYPKFIKM